MASEFTLTTKTISTVTWGIKPTQEVSGRLPLPYRVAKEINTSGQLIVVKPCNLFVHGMVLLPEAVTFAVEELFLHVIRL